ncbi:hypothetical protein H9638_10495 [Arthrobacter sp. Sa2BUA2]|uniref:Alpha/beta hydrolase n=1 Tax=Arthrobacter pullicola TaxID=2762224 RepID=A0ABR8YJ59_9MICC|nr:hypothetical protein [Arthrobacter pullicola]MBD8044234.1 hypothetical protein [Arthrobacter pullicola]
MMHLSTLPDITGDWTRLDALAQDLLVRAGVAEGYLSDATTAWQRVGPAYREPATQDLVHAAMDSLAEPMALWRASLVSAAGIIQDFAAAALTLAEELRQLTAEQPRELVEGDDPVQHGKAVDSFNTRADGLTAQWNTLQQDTAARLASVSGGSGEGLPMTAYLGSQTLPRVSWASLTSTLDERLGAVTPGALLLSLRGLDTAELKAWAEANPEGAALLAANKLVGPFPLGSPEAALSGVMDDSQSKEGIAAIRAAWLDLSAADQEKLLLLYPAVFGALNGVPFASRAHANTVTVAGYRHTARRDLASLKEPSLADYSQSRAGAAQWGRDHGAWKAEKARLETVLKGLDFATDRASQVILVSSAADGRIVTMHGSPSDAVDRTAVLVPGTGADLGTLASYTDRLDAINGDSAPEKLSFYWQGTDLPNELHHNLTSAYNEDGGPLLAAFDHALDLEVPANTRSTYVGYSAGGSLLGTGEREGLTASNILYVAPAGIGHEVSSPSDTGSPDANRYWIQTRDDPITAAQVAGGGFHSGSFWSGGVPTAQMDAVRLESGFVNPKKPDSLMKGHSDYFVKGSTSAANMQSVIEGGRVSLYVDEVLHNGFGYSYWESPIEERPEDYTTRKLQTVTTESLEK